WWCCANAGDTATPQTIIAARNAARNCFRMRAIAHLSKEPGGEEETPPRLAGLGGTTTRARRLLCPHLRSRGAGNPEDKEARGERVGRAETFIFSGRGSKRDGHALPLAGRPSWPSPFEAGGPASRPHSSLRIEARGVRIGRGACHFLRPRPVPPSA